MVREYEVKAGCMRAFCELNESRMRGMLMVVTHWDVRCLKRLVDTKSDKSPRLIYAIFPAWWSVFLQTSTKMGSPAVLSPS